MRTTLAATALLAAILAAPLLGSGPAQALGARDAADRPTTLQLDREELPPRHGDGATDGAGQ